MTDAQHENLKGFDEETRPNFKLPKWIIITGAVLAVLIVISLIIPSFLDQSKYKEMIISKVEESTGYKVSWVGDLGIAILPVPHVTVHEATVQAGATTFLKLKEASVSVELLPLLSKQIEISSIKLIEPDITLTVDAAGRKTWMTDKLEKDNDVSQQDSKSENDKNSSALSIGSVHIEKGHIIYKDLQKNSTHEIVDLNADVKLDSLSGPFELSSSLAYNGNKIELKGETGKIEAGKPAPIDMDVKFPELNVSGSYKGDISSGDEMRVQGDLKLSAKDLQKTLSALSKKETELPEGLNGSFDLSAAVLFDGDNAVLDKATIALGDLAYTGNVKLSGLKTSAAPKLSMDLTSTARDVKTKEALVKALSDLDVKGTGQFVDNVITIDQGRIGFQGQTINMSGTYALPATSASRPRVNAIIKADRIDLDELTRQISPATESAAQKAVNQKNSQEASKAPAIKGFTLPFDGNLQGQIGSLVTGGKTYSALNFNVTNTGENLSISNFSLMAPSSTAVSVNGTVGNLGSLSGLNLNANVKTANVEALAKAYNAPLKLEQTLGAASLGGNFKGSLDNLTFNATVNAMNFAVTAAGNVKNAMTVPQIDTLDLRIKHPSLQSAVRNFSPTFEAPGNFGGPLDISTILSLKNKKYDLSNLKGNLGGVSVGGVLSADVSGAKPSITGDMAFGNMIFETPAPKAGTSSPSSTPAASTSSGGETRWSREAIDTAWMNKFNADLKIRAATISQGLWKLSNANLAFKLQDGNLTINNMDAKVFGGDMAINGTMKGGDAKTPLNMNWAVKASSINAQQLISALQNKQSDTLSGTIKNFDVNIAATGLSPAALVYSLSGKGGASGNNLIVKGVDAAKLADAARGSYKPLERAGSLFGSFREGQTAFSTFDAAFTIANGIVNFSQIKFDGDQATLASTGNVNLPRWTIDLKNSMTVKNSDVPPFDFAIRGPLDAPLQTGGSVIENFLSQKAQAKIEKLITDKLGEKLGFPIGGSASPSAPATNETVPAAGSGEVAPASPAPMTKEEQKAQQIQEGVKALQGLFGQ